MPSDEPSQPPETAARKSRGVRAFLRKMRRRLSGEGDTRGGDAVIAHDTSAADLVDSAEAFQSLRVHDVMTPRADIVAVDIATTFSDVLARFVEAEHSRMPIYRDTLDDPVGFVHVKEGHVAAEAAGQGAGGDAQLFLGGGVRRVMGGIGTHQLSFGRWAMSAAS